MSNITNSFNSLKSYCEKEKFAGWDPYDGLNSKVFKATPFRHWDLARLAWIQGFKRSPINFRRLLRVPKAHNNMGLGLFLSGYCKLHQLAENGMLDYGTTEKISEQIEELGQLILKYESKGYSGSCWGYNFDWQARRLFLFPAGTPNVVVTAFCAEALFDAHAITGTESFLKAALSASDFVSKDLNRSDYKGGILFSYSPQDGNNTVFNASLLGANILLRNYEITKDESKLLLAKNAVDAAISGQAEDGSWVYGLLPVQSWIDSFHTGFNLNALQLYYKITKEQYVADSIAKGKQFYLANFFLEDGTPKYYHDRTYPIDIHCPGQLLVTLRELDAFQENKVLADSVLSWTITNMQDKKGYFYYQLKKGWSSKIPYMRWSNAFMFNAMSAYLISDYGK
ncbi:MAG: delta-aminolevulinic acid dehydratase [Lishizhenia sp.]